MSFLRFFLTSLLLSCSFHVQAQFCSFQGVISFNECGGSGIFIQTKGEDWVDPADDVLYEVVLPENPDANPYDGQTVEFGIASTFETTCTEADQGAILNCLDYTSQPQVDWHYACPSLSEFVVPPCDGISIDVYVLNGDQFYYVHDNGSSDFYDECTIVCSGSACLAQAGIDTPPTAQFECGDEVSIYSEITACLGETIWVSASYPPGIWSDTCNAQITISPETNVVSQPTASSFEVLVTEDITYSLQWVADPDATCSTTVTETVYTSVITAEPCEECDQVLDCDDGECSNGQEYWDEFSCTCESDFFPECNHPMALNYDPDATCPLLHYCEFPPIANPLCLGDSVLVGMFSLSDVILCEDGYIFGLDSSDPEDNSMNYAGYVMPWGAPQEIVGWWVKPGVGETTYNYWHTNTPDCEPATTTVTINVVDCDLPSGIDEQVQANLRLHCENGALNIFTESEILEIDYRVYSISGQVCKQGVLGAQQGPIDVSNLASGLYLFESSIGSELFLVQ